jgi:hypothetical protein
VIGWCLFILSLGGALVMAPDHSVLDRILADVVRDERVDYQRLGRQHRRELSDYLAKMATVDPGPLGPQDRLALYINLYNATVLHEVVRRREGDPAWRADADDFALFKQPLVTMHARKLSLNELENDVIRAQFKDPRVHAALVCAARSCPPLLPRAYHGEDLDRALTENMRRFLENRSRNTIDDARKELKLSRIFDWYAGDFGGKDGVGRYVGQILGRDFDGYAVSFLEYSWELNDVNAGTSRPR